ncbi:glutamic acid-rich protein-like [Agrilus planipennis]|uniref:Glutamic acid-rich protein-like n=1 Tax=Agrilus planipennis TaxID=224129 RepID=A0A7F5R5B5_AGRPL|nr:glutamic acid-rich protein-like [Agrilus planipennis]
MKNRRNTIVSPPKLEEIEPDIQPGEERVSDDKTEYYENSDSENYNEPNSAKKKYQELQTTYSRTLDDDLGVKINTQKPCYEDEENEEEWDDEEDDEEEEEDEDDEDGYDIYDNDDDDEELLKKLEAKYGKLNSKQSNEDLNKEESDEDEEDIDYEEDSDDDDQTNTGLKLEKK